MVPFKTLFLTTAMSLGAPLASASSTGDWAFQVFLDDRPIGEQHFQVDRQGDTWRANIEARFDVDFLFFNAYDYAHQNTEVWQDGCLQSLDAQTDDNGTAYRLEGQRQGEQFRLSINGEETLLPGCVMSFAYWNPDILQQSRLLNTQDGRYMPVTITQVGQETVEVLGQSVAAVHYRLDAEELHIDLWYAQDDGRWLKLESLVEDNRLVFQPQAGGGQVAELR